MMVAKDFDDTNILKLFIQFPYFLLC